MLPRIGRDLCVDFTYVQSKITVIVQHLIDT